MILYSALSTPNPVCRICTQFPRPPFELASPAFSVRQKLSAECPHAVCVFVCTCVFFSSFRRGPEIYRAQACERRNQSPFVDIVVDVWWEQAARTKLESSTPHTTTTSCWNHTFHIVRCVCFFFSFLFSEMCVFIVCFSLSVVDGRSMARSSGLV